MGKKENSPLAWRCAHRRGIQNRVVPSEGSARMSIIAATRSSPHRSASSSQTVRGLLGVRECIPNLPQWNPESNSYGDQVNVNRQRSGSLECLESVDIN